uniref:Uncharacterized protein n=1 Tax=Romanomermis culicivorax TaxID=13658 RepID=A0A915L3B8_ROMCU
MYLDDPVLPYKWYKHGITIDHSYKSLYKICEGLSSRPYQRRTELENQGIGNGPLSHMHPQLPHHVGTLEDTGRLPDEHAIHH